MAEAWKEAKKYVEKFKDYPDNVISTELEKNEFKQGELTINYFYDNLLGMELNLGNRLRFDKETYDKITNLAKRYALEVDPIYKLGASLWSKVLEKRVAIISWVHFCASDPQLLEDIGREVYGLKI